jgi:hypothetical protein
LHYNIEKTKHGIIIIWSNSHTNDGVNIAILIQYGHGTGTGGYISGRDYKSSDSSSVRQDHKRRLGEGEKWLV